MKDILVIFKIMALGAVVIFLVLLSATIHQVSDDLHETAVSLQKTSTELQQATAQLSTSVRMLQQHTDRILIEAGLTAKETRLASVEQRAYWGTQVPLLTAKVETVLSQSSLLLADVTQTSAQVRTSVSDVSHGLTESLTQANRDLASLDTSIQHFDQLVESPYVLSTLANIDRTTAKVADTSASVALTTADIQGKVHTLTHPTPFQKFKAAFWGVLNLAKTGAEFSYYL